MTRDLTADWHKFAKYKDQVFSKLSFIGVWSPFCILFTSLCNTVVNKKRRTPGNGKEKVDLTSWFSVSSLHLTTCRPSWCCGVWMFWQPKSYFTPDPSVNRMWLTGLYFSVYTNKSPYSLCMLCGLETNYHNRWTSDWHFLHKGQTIKHMRESLQDLKKKGGGRIPSTFKTNHVKKNHPPHQSSSPPALNRRYLYN